MYTDQYIAVQLVAQQAPEGKPGEGAPAGIPKDFLFIMLAMFALLYFIVLRPNRRQEKDRQAMIDALKKNDEVVTIGGIVGKVVNVRNDEITLESSNSRLRILRSSIARVVTPSDKQEPKDKDSDKADSESDSTEERSQKKD